MTALFDRTIPYVGIKLDLTPVTHLGRDLLIALILWNVGLAAFETALVVMLMSGAYETGQGLAFLSDGSRNHFDLLDFLPSAFAGPIVVGLFTHRFDSDLLTTTLLLYLGTAFFLLLVNFLLRRDFIVRHGKEV